MADQLNKYTAYLNQRGFNATNNNESNVIYVRYPKNEDKSTLSIVMDAPFPYEFPKIYIDTDFRNKHSINAHVFSGDSLCLKISGKEFVNPTQSKGVLEYALNKACNIIDRALNGTLNKECSHEIKEYWNLPNKGSTLEGTSFIRGDKIDELVSFGKWHLSNKEVFMYHSGVDYYGKDYITSFGFNDGNRNINYDCIFVRVEKLEIAFELRHISKLLPYLKNLQNNDVNNYLKSRQTGLITIIVKNDMNAQYSTLVLVEEETDTTNLFNATQIKSSNFIPKNLTQSSLFSRSSDGKIDSQFERVLIIGCGSVGGVVASNLASIGTKELYLIDNDILGENNLLRHVCSMTSIGLPKTRALKEHLLNNFPYLTIHDNCNSVFNCSKDLFREGQFDLIVVATADRGSEFYCLDEFLSFGIAPILVTLWMEPFAVSGHALIYSKDNWNKGDFDLLHSNIISLSSVANNSFFFQKEVGCNSAYIPYSGLDVTDFVISLFKTMKKYDNKSFSYTKFLNINFAKRNHDMKINPIYYGYSDNEEIVGEIYYE